MKTLSKYMDCRCWVFSQLLVILVGLSGCGTSDNDKFSDSTAAKTGVPARVKDLERFQKGDMVNVALSGLTDVIPPHLENIKDDGTITLPNIGSIPAEGRTPGELQRDIFNLYVPRLYTSNLNVTVTAPERFYYVGGEVKAPGRIVYNGQLTVTKAIQSAGDFNDFANKKRVKLTRADGTSITVNCLKAMDDASKDPPVFPGDKINVPRRVI